MRISPEQNDQINARMHRIIRSTGITGLLATSIGIAMQFMGKEKTGLDIDSSILLSAGLFLFGCLSFGVAFGGFVLETRRYNKIRRGK